MLEDDLYSRSVGAIRSGDKSAFEQLFKASYARLCVYAESIVRDCDGAEDLVQNVFCNLWEKRYEIDIHASLKSYLYQAVYNAAMNILKHEKVKLTFFEFIQKQDKNSENDIEHFFDKENNTLLFQEINKAISFLPDQCREIFLLSRFSGKKSAEIADDLNISVRTVETQLYRAMKQLREELAHLKNSELLLLFFFSKDHKED